VERRTRLALAKLIAAGDIALVSVAATRARSGRLSIRVTYSNLRTARQKTLTVG
jgi:phage gp46-like protein